MKQALILDPAHGKDTPSKRSPDGRHREYLWSRERIAEIVNITLGVKNLGFDLYYPFLYNENEPGLTNRVKKYNEISKDYDQTFVLSIHNDAYGNGWGKPTGISVWTSKGETDSDPYATILYNHLEAKYPNEKMRPANWLSEKEKNIDPDWEANFTILAGNSRIKPNYDSVLLEFLFQSNKKDVDKLTDPVENLYFSNIISEWLVTQFK